MENVLVRTPWKETWLELEMAGVETTKGWKASRERMESGSGVRCGIAQGGSCEVGTQGTTRFRTRDAPTRGTVTWVPSRDTATEYSHRALSQATHHRVSTQDTVTGHPSLEALPRISATDNCHGSTSQWHINKDTPDEKSSGVSEERQLPTLPPGLAVPSAMTGLASLFGMGRGGSPSL